MRWTRLIFPMGWIAAAFIYGMALTPYIGDAYDDGQYITLARALALGKGYVQLAMPTHPPEPQYPPAWSMMLSNVWLVAPDFPANAIAFKVVSVFCALGLAWLVLGWLRWRGESELYASLAALLTLFNPLILGIATSAFSEIAYTCFSILALWLVERYQRRASTSWVDAIVPALATAWGVYLRTFGITLALAGIIFLALQSKRRKAFIYATLVGLFVAPWFVRGALLPNTVWGYSQQFWLVSMEQPELGVISLGGLLVRVVLNLRAYLLAGLPGALLPSQVPLTYVNLAEGLRVGAPFMASDIVLAMIVAGALIGQIFLRRSLSDWYVAFYLGLALLWPWEPTRFSIPLIPLLYASVFTLGAQFAPMFKPSSPRGRGLRWIVVGSIGLFILANLVTQVQYAWTIRQSPPSAEWQARLRLFDWLKQNTSPTSVLAAMNDSQVYLYTDRQVIRALGSAEAIQQFGVEYIVLVPYGGVMVEGDLSRIRFEPLYRKLPDAFTSVYLDSMAGIQVFRVQPGAIH